MTFVLRHYLLHFHRSWPERIQSLDHLDPFVRWWKNRLIQRSKPLTWIGDQGSLNLSGIWKKSQDRPTSFCVAGCLVSIRAWIKYTQLQLCNIIPLLFCRGIILGSKWLFPQGEHQIYLTSRWYSIIENYCHIFWYNVWFYKNASESLLRPYYFLEFFQETPTSIDSYFHGLSHIALVVIKLNDDFTVGHTKVPTGPKKN